MTTKKIIKKQLFSLLILTALMVTSCAETTNQVKDEPAINQVNMAVQNTSEIKTLRGFLFSNGVLVNKYSNITLDAMNRFKIDLVDGENLRLYMIANMENVIDDNFTVGSYTETNFNSLVTKSSSPENSAYPFLTAMHDISRTPNPQSISMLRGYAGVNFDMSSNPNIVLNSFTITKVANASYLMPHFPASTPSGTGTITINKTFEPGLSGKQMDVCHLYEQSGEPLKVVINATLNGVNNTMVAYLPREITRNNMYNIIINGTGAKLEATVEVLDWVNNNSSDAIPDITSEILIDPLRSELPADVRINSGNDTVFVPYWGAAFKLALDANAETELSVESGAATITPVVASKSNMIGNMFNITVPIKAPGLPKNYITLKIRNKNLDNYYGDYIVLAVDESKTVFTGKMAEHFDGTTTCTFPTYDDGEIGRASLLSGSTITSDQPWIRIEKIGATDTYKVLAGFKPNDPEADGRLQTATITVTHPSEGRTESYIVKRKYELLPMVLMNDTYWCHYNIKGNSKRFEDQIKTQPVGDVLDYFLNMANELVIPALGDGYKGINQNGMPLIYANNKFVHQNYGSTPENGAIGSAPVTAHCPNGYQIPTRSDYKAILSGASDAIALAEMPSSGRVSVSYTTAGGKSATMECARRNSISYGGGVASVYFYKIQLAGQSPLVITGPGHQYQNDQPVIPESIIMATAGTNSNKTWTFSPRRVSLDPNNEFKSRSLRCIKSPAFTY